jgi:hypothetical protein
MRLEEGTHSLTHSFIHSRNMSAYYVLRKCKVQWVLPYQRETLESWKQVGTALPPGKVATFGPQVKDL